MIRLKRAKKKLCKVARILIYRSLYAGGKVCAIQTAVEFRDLEKSCKKNSINNDLELAHPHSGPLSN